MCLFHEITGNSFTLLENVPPSVLENRKKQMIFDARCMHQEQMDGAAHVCTVLYISTPNLKEHLRLHTTRFIKEKSSFQTGNSGNIKQNPNFLGCRVRRKITPTAPKKTWLINCTVLLLSSLLSALSFRLALYSCFISRFLLFPSSSLSALVLLSLNLCSCFLARFLLLLSSSLFALAV